MSAHSPEPTPEWTLADLFAVLVRRRAWIFSSVALFSLVALVYCLCATRRYRATAIIEIQKESHGAYGLENTTTDKDSTAVADSFDLNLTLQTETAILGSDSLALDVISRDGLETTPDYFAPRPAHFAWARKLFFWRKPLEPLSTPLADAPNRRYAALRIFASHLKTSTLPGTRLIRIDYSDPDPVRAAAVVNDLIQSLSDYGYRSRSSSAAQSANRLAAQLAGLKQQAESLDAHAVALQSATGSYGEDASHNVVLTRLDELNAQLAAAQSSRIVREAVWRAVQSGDPEIISGLSGTVTSGVNTQNSFALLQSLRTQESAARAQIAESASRYGENWPAVAEQRARLAAIQKSIQDEVRRLADRARSDYDIALQSENSARDAFNQQKDLATRMSGSVVAWRLVRQEADESRALYTTLLGRLQQTGVLEGLHSANFVVVSPAQVPPPNRPTSPNLPLFTAIALGAGLTLGSAAAIARELTDDTVRGRAELEALLDCPVFATLPAQQPRAPWHLRLLPSRKSSALALEAAGASDWSIGALQPLYVEALHCLRASLLLSRSSRTPQVIAILGAELESARTHPPHQDGSGANSSEEERPSLALSLAAVFAQHGASVLCVDADLRNAPSAGVTPVPAGLSDLLAGGAPPCFDHQDNTPSLLSVLHTGPRPPSASQLIASSQFATLLAKWRQEFSFVIIRGPATQFADALVLAQLSDAVLVAAEAGRTPKSAILPAFHSLSRQVPDDAVLGLVLENVPAGAAYAHA